MWTYEQSTGRLLLEGKLIATGYSGFGEGKNNPALEGVVGIGPIPRGVYLIGPPQCVTTAGPLGPYVLPLVPQPGTATHGRAGFFAHGDSTEHPGAASHGCIALPRPAREALGLSTVRELHVVA